MKKFLVFGLILAIAGGAFAQSFTIGGGISTGLAVQWDEDGVEARMRYPAEHNGIRITLTGDSVNALGTVGTNFELRWDDVVMLARWDNEESGEAWIGYVPEVKRANVWVGLVPNVLTLSFGIGGPGGFATPGPLANSLDVAEGDLNVTMLINPVPQVTIGATVNLPEISTDIGGAGWGFHESDIYYSLGVRVNLENAANIVLNFTQNLDSKEVDMAAGFNLLALRAFTFGVDLALKDFFGDDDLVFSFGHSSSLIAGNFQADLNGRYFRDIGPDNNGLVMLYDANFQYSFGAVTPRLGLGFGWNTSRPEKDDFYSELKPSSALVEEAAFPSQPWVSMIFNPNVLFNFGASDLEIGFSLYFDGFDEDLTIYNALYFGYKYNF